jgi:glycosyltransferase involved in cell wall biosynthesis
MKKLFIVNTLSSGGAEKVVATLANKMATDGDEVHIILLYDKITYEINEKVNIHLLTNKKSMNSFKKTLSLLSLSVKLRRLVKNLERTKPFDLITSHLIVSDILAFFSKLDSYSCIHNNYSNHPVFKKTLFRNMLRIIYRDKKVLGISKGVLTDWTQVLKINAKETNLVYNPIDYKKVKEKAKERNDFSQIGKYIVHVGRFNKQKRHDILIKSFGRLNSELKLVLIGEGETKEATKELVNKMGLSDRVIFAGWRENPYPIIRGAKLLVLSSDTEGLPIVILESISCGTPVVSTEFNGIRELMKQPLNNYIATVGDTTSIAEKIKLALQDSRLTSVNEQLIQEYWLENVVENYRRLS